MLIRCVTSQREGWETGQSRTGEKVRETRQPAGPGLTALGLHFLNCGLSSARQASVGGCGCGCGREGSRRSAVG